MIPDKTNDEWKKLITGENPIEFSSFALQMAISRLNLSYREGKIKIEDAVDELYVMCVKYKKAVENDIKKIFKI